MDAALILKTGWFEKYARKERISDRVLVAAIRRAEKGLIDAELGSGLIELRIARPGQGRSGGYRTIVAFQSERLAVFMFGFAKNTKANLAASELAAFRIAAQHTLQFSDKVIREMLRNGSLVEVKDGKGKDVPE